MEAVTVSGCNGMRDAQDPTVKTLSVDHYVSGCTPLVSLDVSITLVLQLGVGLMYTLARTSMEDAVSPDPLYCCLGTAPDSHICSESRSLPLAEE